MGAKLLTYYAFAKEQGGALFQMRLAVATGLPSTRAGDAPDSPENIKKFQDAVFQVTGKRVD